MPRGGSRAGAGRTPDTGSLAEAIRIEAGAIRTLPKVRTGAAPAWPLSTATPRETTVWRRLWKRPQAILWEEQGAHDEVAMYVRTFCEAEERGVPAARRTLLLQQQNALLITHTALTSAGYRISTNPTAAAPTVAASTPAAAKRQVPSARGRLRLVPNDGDDTP